MMGIATCATSTPTAATVSPVSRAM
jgi:hypothetical protein